LPRALPVGNVGCSKTLAEAKRKAKQILSPIYEENEIVKKAAERGTLLASELAELRGKPHVADVRSLGMIAAIELGKIGGDAGSSALATRVRKELFAKGILIRPLGNIVYLMPPLVASREIIKELAGSLCEAVLRL